MDEPNPALAVLDPIRLRAYADGWRKLSARWAAMADEASFDLAVKLRETAQQALFAAHEVDVLLARKPRESSPA